MRPPGGYTPDMINYAQSVDTYQIYADIMCYDEIRNVSLDHPKYYCVYAARRDRLSYKYDVNEITSKYKENIKMHERMSDVFAGAMGNEFFIAKFEDFDEMQSFRTIVLEKK